MFYRRFEQEESFETRIYKLIGDDHENGVTFDDFIHDHKHHFSDRSSVMAAIDRLIKEGKVCSIEPCGGPGRSRSAKLYACMILAG